MNHKATAKCPNGHITEFGTCTKEVTKFFGGTKICGSKGFDEIYSDSLQCVGCNTIFQYKFCLICGKEIPITE